MPTTLSKQFWTKTKAAFAQLLIPYKNSHKLQPWSTRNSYEIETHHVLHRETLETFSYHRNSETNELHTPVWYTERRKKTTWKVWDKRPDVQLPNRKRKTTRAQESATAKCKTAKRSYAKTYPRLNFIFRNSDSPRARNRRLEVQQLQRHFISAMVIRIPSAPDISEPLRAK